MNEVKDVPHAFKDWIAENAERIDLARAKGTEPYFLEDNKKYWNGGNGKLTPLEIAEIKQRWNNRVFERGKALYGGYVSMSKADERKYYLLQMQPLLNKKVVMNGNGHNMKVGFTKYGNKHLYSDTFGRCKFLQKDDLKDVDTFLQKAEFVKKVGLSKDRKDNIKRFYYYKVGLRGETIYLNVAETDTIMKHGNIWHTRFLYSITDNIK